VIAGGAGGLGLSFAGLQRAKCVVGIGGQPYWLRPKYGVPDEFYYTAIFATAAYVLGFALNWVWPWWVRRSERRRQRQRRAA
jgi:hypothetical protein